MVCRVPGLHADGERWRIFRRWEGGRILNSLNSTNSMQKSEGLTFETWEDLLNHFGGDEELKSRIISACDYDYPDVTLDDLGDGPAIVLDAPSSGGAVVQSLTFPISESEFWRQVEDLDARLNESVEVLDLPHIEHDAYWHAADTLVKALSQLLQVAESDIVNAIGGGWISCDELVPSQHRGMLRWFSVGEPVLAVMGIGRQQTTIAAARYQPGGLGGPPLLELGESMEVGTRDLLEGVDDIGVDFLNEIITKTRRRLRLCRGCRQMRDWVSDRGDFKGLCMGCQSLFTGIVFD